MIYLDLHAWIYLLQKNSINFGLYKVLAQMVSDQFSKNIKIFRYDNALVFKDK